MENQIHSKNTSNTELSMRIGDFFPVLLATVVAIVEWASWKPGSSLIADFIPGITQSVSFMLAISLLCLSIFLLATSEGIKNVAVYYSIDIFAGTKALNWKPGKQRAAELVLPAILLIVIIILVLRTLPQAKADLSKATTNVSLIYFLAFAAAILARIKIPAFEVPVVPKGGMVYELNTMRKNLNLTGYPTYVLTDQVYLRSGNMLAVDGQRFVVFDSHRSLSAVETIEIVSPAFAATLKVVITPLTGNFPDRIDQDDLPKVLHWHSASPKDRKDMLEISAAGLSGVFEKYLKQMFGITEQGQFIFDSLSRTIKANAMRGLDILAGIDLKDISSRLEMSLSRSLFGAAVFHKPVYRIELSFISHELKGHFAQLNNTIGNINLRNDKLGVELREQSIKAVLKAYEIFLTPENFQQSADQIKTLFEEPSVLKLHKQERPVISMQPNIADQQTLGSFENIFQKSEGLTRLGSWLNGQQEVKRLAREKEMINRLYFTMIEFRLISHLPAGMDSNRIMQEIEAHFEEDIAEILNPDSAIYGTEMQKMAIAERVPPQNESGTKIYGLMKYTFVYHLDCVPEYDFDALEGKEYREARLLQKGFMDNVVAFLSVYGRFSLELRFQNNPADLRLDTWLVISGISDQSNITDKSSFRKQLEGLLPEHYAYNSIPEDKVSGILLPESMFYGFKLSRRPEVTPVGRFNMQYAGTMLLSPLTNYEQGAKDSEASKISFSVPSMSEIADSSDNWYTLCRQIQLSPDPLALRIAITQEELTAMEKRLATHYYRELLEHPLQTAVRTEYERAQLAGMGKYLENSWLFGANIQVGSMDRFTGQRIAASLANLICGAGKLFAEEVAIPDNITASIWKNWLHTELEYDLPAALPCRIRTTAEEDFFRRGIALFSPSEIGNIFKIPVADHRGLPGLFSKRANPFYAPQLSKKMDKTIKLGRLIQNRAFVSVADARSSDKNHPSEEYHINLADMPKHVFLCGVPGSGKTFCTKSIISGLLAKDVPFLLIEPCKSEYYDDLKEQRSASGKRIRLFQFSSPYLKDGSLDRSFLRFNPLIPRKGSTIAEHISSLKSALMAAMPMQGVMPGIFSDFLNEFYLTFTGQDEKLFFDRDFVSAGLKPAEYSLSVSSFSDFSAKYFIDPKRFINSKGQMEVVAILMKRITKFTTGTLGQIFKPEYCGSDTALMEKNIDDLLNEPCVLDLEALGDDEDKALMMAFVLTFLNQDRMKRKSHDESNQLHVALVEEAHRLFQSGTPGGNLEQGETMGAAAKAGSLFNNLLAESRAKAQSVVIIEQSPTKMPADVIKNTNLKIQLRLNYQEDREYIGKAMSMNKEQIEFSGLLRPGEAVVFDDTLDKPILIKIEK